MATPNYTPEQISALRALRDRLRSAQYTWEVRQLLKNTASATGIKQLQLVQWQDGDNNRKNLLHFLVDERLEKVAIILIEVFWNRKEEDQRQLMHIITYPKCYIDSPEGSGDYTVERLAEGRNCEQLVDIISRFRELCPQDTGEEDEDEEEETEEERATTIERMRRLQRLSTPIPRTPSPSNGSLPTVPLEPANFSPLHVFTTTKKKKKKTPLHPPRAARPVSSSPRSTPPLARGGTPVEITIWSSPPPLSPSPAAATQTPTLLRGSSGAHDDQPQPSTPPPFIPSTPPPAPGARDTPLWYPPSDHSEHSEHSEPEPEPERDEQRVREGQRIQRHSPLPPPGSSVPVLPERTPEPVTPVQDLRSVDELKPGYWGVNMYAEEE
ncbi:hypothetical protein NEUTE1DRAFT_99055 [Neurospora tetrasperma FGSC 2508]|uniref:Uncharacterized protein n=1 Tax=Neurospora tetrasperma (strain FGSC 2508 / ATCC MYA-4615 / P0657) TaxID=510951 RepID=F8MHU5_NEUT8|nr:uncharacterized protein NEUTE1DRAFT_99055 [Neurospora tetrasperma FGSC 2508]EGO58854.1 hypothetical protein NEUTE1DRAFT_99055 [Neurospora tetrasperma FGSC 2508]